MIRTFAVTAGRGAGHLWVFRCPEFPDAIARGRSLAAAYDLMPAEIAGKAGIAPDAVEIDLIPQCEAVPLDEARATLPHLVADPS